MPFDSEPPDGTDMLKPKHPRRRRMIVLVGLTLLVALWTLRRHPDNTLPLEEVVDRSLLKQPGGVNLVVLDRRTVTYTEGTQKGRTHSYHLTLALANDGDRTIQYSGYPVFDRFGTLENGFIAPSYDLEIPQGAGWTRQGDRCGTGLESLVIRPGQAAYFDVHQRDDQPVFRLSLTYRDVGDRRGRTNRIVVSESIDARGSPAIPLADVKPIRRRTMSSWLVAALHDLFR